MATNNENSSLILRIENVDNCEAALRDCQDWLRQEQVPGMTVEQVMATPTPGTLGTGLEALAIVLASKAVATLIECVFRVIDRWIQARCRKARVIFEIPSKGGRGPRLKITVESMDPNG
jgi:hypothetical protein